MAQLDSSVDFDYAAVANFRVTWQKDEEGVEVAAGANTLGDAAVPGTA